MTRYIKYAGYLSLFIFLLTACNNFKRLGDRAKLILKNDKKLFRGLDFEMSLKQVKELETAHLEDEFSNYLRYKVEVDSMFPGEYLALEYSFNSKDQLDVIYVYYTLEDKSLIDPIVNDLKEYFSNEYGQPKVDELGWYKWKFEDKTGVPGTVEITLSGEKKEDYLGVYLDLQKFYEFEERL